MKRYLVVYNSGDEREERFVDADAVGGTPYGFLGFVRQRRVAVMEGEPENDLVALYNPSSIISITEVGIEGGARAGLVS